MERIWIRNKVSAVSYTHLHGIIASRGGNTYRHLHQLTGLNGTLHFSWNVGVDRIIEIHRFDGDAGSRSGRIQRIDEFLLVIAVWNLPLQLAQTVFLQADRFAGDVYKRQHAHRSDGSSLRYPSPHP